MSKDLKKKYILLYVLSTFVAFLVCFFVLKNNGFPLRYTKMMFIIVEISLILNILGSIIRNYLLLKLIRVNIGFVKVYNEFAWMYIMAVIIAPVFAIVSLKNIFIIGILNRLVDVLILLCQAYIIKTKYGVNIKKCIVYVCANILLMFLIKQGVSFINDLLRS